MKKVAYCLFACVVTGSILLGVGCQKKQVKPAPNEFGAISAESWKDIYPDQYESYRANMKNDVVEDYLVDYPMLKTLFAGIGYEKSYGSARGHLYTLEDVNASARPHPLANCLSCKSADYTAIVNRDGPAAYKYDFTETFSTLTQEVSCYNCHGNDVPVVQPTHDYLKTALGDNMSAIAPQTLVCGQCHVDYYFDAETKMTTLPYSSVEGMHPDKMLEYYNDRNWVDYTNPRTKTPQIFVQHAEMETFLSEGSVHKNTMNCATCHMGTATNAKGTEYISHMWTSPLENEALLASNCSKCHSDLKTTVANIQKAAEDKTYEVGYKLEDLTNKLAVAVGTGAHPEAKLDEIRTLNRNAQFYWNYVMAENSEGAHNSKLTHYCLDKANELTEQAITLVAKL